MTERDRDNVLFLFLFVSLAAILFCALAISNHRTDVFNRQTKKYMI